MTEWRTQFRRQANEFDSAAHTKAVDSLLNYETVKYFNNEGLRGPPLRRKSGAPARGPAQEPDARCRMLNAGQQLDHCRGAGGHAVARHRRAWSSGRLTLGDLVMINAFMIQLYIPLNFLGVIYREIKQSLTDLDKMFALMDKEREVADAPGAQPLQGLAQPTGAV